MEYCEQQIGKPFDKRIVCFDFIPMVTDTEDSRFICTRLASKSLIKAGVLPATIRTDNLSPIQFHDILIQSSIYPVYTYDP
jgi:hypothetical protein